MEKNSIDVQDGESYTISLYVHNNNPSGDAAIAEDVKAMFSLPTTVSKSHTINGYIDCSNSQPTRYWDGVTLQSDDFFYIEYVKGSATFTNTKMGTIPISDSVITTGIPLGYSSFDGRIPGCYEYEGQVKIDVTVHKSVAAGLKLTARLKGTEDWNEEVWANIGDEVEYQIEYINLSSNSVDNIMIRDVLPNNVEYIEGSTYLYNGNHQEGIQLIGDTVATSGINIGGYAPRGNAYVRFTVRIKDVDLADGLNQLVNWANVTILDLDGLLYKDDVSIYVKK